MSRRGDRTTGGALIKIQGYAVTTVRSLQRQAGLSDKQFGYRLGDAVTLAVCFAVLWQVCKVLGWQVRWSFHMHDFLLVWDSTTIFDSESCQCQWTFDFAMLVLRCISACLSCVCSWVFRCMRYGIVLRDDLVF